MPGSSPSLKNKSPNHGQSQPSRDTSRPLRREGTIAIATSVDLEKIGNGFSSAHLPWLAQDPTVIDYGKVNTISLMQCKTVITIPFLKRLNELTRISRSLTEAIDVPVSKMEPAKQRDLLSISQQLCDSVTKFFEILVKEVRKELQKIDPELPKGMPKANLLGGLIAPYYDHVGIVDNRDKPEVGFIGFQSLLYYSFLLQRSLYFEEGEIRDFEPTYRTIRVFPDPVRLELGAMGGSQKFQHLQESREALFAVPEWLSTSEDKLYYLLSMTTRFLSGTAPGDDWEIQRSAGEIGALGIVESNGCVTSAQQLIKNHGKFSKAPTFRQASNIIDQIQIRIDEHKKFIQIPEWYTGFQYSAYSSRDPKPGEKVLSIGKLEVVALVLGDMTTRCGTASMVNSLCAQVGKVVQEIKASVSDDFQAPILSNSFSEYRLASMDGKILFENMGELLAVYGEWAALHAEQVSPLQWKQKPYALLLGAERVTPRSYDGRYELTLRSIGDEKFALSLISGVELPIDNRKEDALLHLGCFIDAINHVSGGNLDKDPKVILRRISNLTFGSEKGNKILPGYEILDRALLALTPQFRQEKDPLPPLVRLVNLLRESQRAALQKDVKYEDLGTPVREIIHTSNRAALNEKVIVCAEVEPFLARRILGARDFLQTIKDPIERLSAEKKRDIVIAYMSNEVDGTIDLFADIVNQIVELQKIGARELLTTDLADLRIATPDGRIVFENFGHLCGAWQILTREMGVQVGLLDHLLSQSTSNAFLTKRMEGAIEVIGMARDFRVVDTHFHSDVQKKYGLRGKNVKSDMHLDFGPYGEEQLGAVSCGSDDFKDAVVRSMLVMKQIMGQPELYTPEQIGKALCSIEFASFDGTRSESAIKFLSDVHKLAPDHLVRFSPKGKRESFKVEKSIGIVFEVCKEAPIDYLKEALPKELHLPKGTLFHAICALFDRENSAKEFHKFEKWLEVDTAEQPILEERRPLKIFSDIVDGAMAHGAKINLQDVSTNYLVELLHQICIRRYNGDLAKIRADLAQEMSELQGSGSVRSAIVTEMLEQVVPVLEERYRKQETCIVPESVKLAPFLHQRDAAINSIFFDRPILVVQPGGGKTTSMALACEMLGAKGVLWVTKSGIRVSTHRELSTKVLNGKSVSLLDPILLQKDPQVLDQLLSSSDYIVVGYDTLREVCKRNSVAMQKIQSWMKERVLILDEGHLIDHARSGRSKAIATLNPVKTIIGSGTPYQHKPSRVANLLALALPHKFNRLDLEALFEREPAAARAVLHAHSTVFSLEDISQPFEPPEVRSFKDQLSEGIPRVPQMVESREQYCLSREHSIAYIEIALDFNRWARARGFEPSARRRYESFRRLSLVPEMLGLTQANELVDAVKRIAIPAMARGEKVLVLSFQKPPLHLLANDPEIGLFGAVSLTGDSDITERSRSVTALEEDPEIRIGLGQMNAIGAGFNIRSISHVIVIDRPPQSSDLFQAIHRPIRILGPGDERFARQYVKTTYLEPVLSNEVLSVLPDAVREKMSNGTIYNSWLSRSLADLDRFRSFLVRGEAPSADSVTLSGLLNDLEKAHAGIDFKAIQGVFSPESFRSPLLQLARYNNPNKNRWREEKLAKFLQKNIEKLGKPVNELKVAVLAGPEGLEIPIYLELGVLPENIYVFEGSKNAAWREAVRSMAHSVGAKFFASSIEVLLPFLKERFDVVSIDPDGYTTPAIAQMFATMPLNKRAIILKNTLAMRERGDAKKMVLESEGDRRLLDINLIRLTGTLDTRESKGVNPVSLVSRASKARAAARKLAPLVAPLIQGEVDLVGSMLVELTLGSRHALDLAQGRYHTPGGSPFNHTFALLGDWSSEALRLSSARELRAIMEERVNLVTPGSRSMEFSLGKGLVKALNNDGKKLMSYYSSHSSSGSSK